MCSFLAVLIAPCIKPINNIATITILVLDFAHYVSVFKNGISGPQILGAKKIYNGCILHFGDNIYLTDMSQVEFAIANLQFSVSSFIISRNGLLKPTIDLKIPNKKAYYHDSFKYSHTRCESSIVLFLRYCFTYRIPKLDKLKLIYLSLSC